MSVEMRDITNQRLVDMLKAAGVYEDGMEEEEMRQLADAMQMSIIENCQQQVNELDFMSLQSSDLHSSTLIVAPQVPTSTVTDPWDTPPTDPIYLTVEALVHHALDWSPSKEEGLPRTRKRSSADNNPPLIEQSAKRSLRLLSEGEETQGEQQQGEQPYNPDATPVSLNHDACDSGVSWEEVSLFSGSDASSMPSIGELPSGHLVSSSSVAVSESSDSHEEVSRDLVDE